MERCRHGYGVKKITMGYFNRKNFVVNNPIAYASLLTAFCHPQDQPYIFRHHQLLGFRRAGTIHRHRDELLRVDLADLAQKRAHVGRVHKVHHLDPDLDVSTGFRFGEVSFSTGQGGLFVVPVNASRKNF
jgi:hypothetical protein